jgi:hypothetical protein
MSAPPQSVNALELIDDLNACADRAGRWLMSHMNPDGSIGDPKDGFTYYRAPWSFTLLGQSDAAHAICGWVRANLLTPQGDLSAPARITNEAWAYSDGTFIVGAHMLQQYDLSYGLMPALLRWQDPQSGAFGNDRLPDGSMSDDMDIPFACGAGFACLLTGRLDEARKVAGFLETIYNAQPDITERFYCFWSRSRQAPITEADPDFQLRFVVENTVDRMQRWTIGGISAAFLCRMHLVDPQPRYLELARKYQAFSMAATEAQFSYPSACKSSWGAALLYQVTGEQRYLDWLGRFGQWYMSAQEPEGFWHPWVEETTGDVIDITIEYLMHVLTLTGAVSSRRTLRAVT